MVCCRSSYRVFPLSPESFAHPPLVTEKSILSFTWEVDHFFLPAASAWAVHLVRLPEMTLLFYGGRSGIARSQSFNFFLDLPHCSCAFMPHFTGRASFFFGYNAKSRRVMNFF